jgi:hypothetical protein
MMLVIDSYILKGGYNKFNEEYWVPCQHQITRLICRLSIHEWTFIPNNCSISRVKNIINWALGHNTQLSIKKGELVMSTFEQLSNNKGTVSSALGKVRAKNVLNSQISILLECIGFASYEPSASTQ